MKPLEEAHIAIIDAGNFVSLSEGLSRSFGKVSYYSPYESEFLEIEKCVIGDGCDGFDRVDEYMDPEFFNSVDCWAFPDVGFGGFQRYLRSLGKLVWGSMGASDLELFRTRFIKTLYDVGLPVIESHRIQGLTALDEFLKAAKGEWWIKLNRYRGNFETTKHSSYPHSRLLLDRLAVVFGPMKERIVFVVQKAIKDEEDSPVLEVGYDGWMVTSPDGEPQFPPCSFQGEEGKNELYLGSLLDWEELPDDVRLVNEKIAPILASYGYRNFWATEIRIKDGVPYFIDPTARMAGMTMEHNLRSCSNLARVIYEGAQGKIVVPEFLDPFAAEATLHYTGEKDGWKFLEVPESLQDWVWLYRYCCIEGMYHFPPHKSDELGVVCGSGDTIEQAIESLNEHFEELSYQPVKIETAGFVDLLKQIKAGEDEGIMFSDQEVPSPESIVAD